MAFTGHGETTVIRLPDIEGIVVETIHSSFQVSRAADLGTYASPGRVRSYDLVILEERSQTDDVVGEIVFTALQGLPQRPIVAFAGDLSVAITPRMSGRRGGAITLRRSGRSMRSMRTSSGTQQVL